MQGIIIKLESGYDSAVSIWSLKLVSRRTDPDEDRVMKSKIEQNVKQEKLTL